MPVEAAVAIGPDLVHVVLMPSKHSSGHSVTDAGDLVDHAEYMRRQYPPGPKITPRDFGAAVGCPSSTAGRNRTRADLGG
jgi:hypothetical protein